MSTTTSTRLADNETCEEFEKHKAVRPPNFGTMDDRRYVTHWPVHVLALNADDLVDESNFHTMWAELERYREIEDPDDPDGYWLEDAFYAQEKHWAHGPVDVIYVRIRDKEGEFTEAWRAAVAMLAALRDYPILSDSDYSERQTERFTKLLDEEMAGLSAEHPDIEKATKKAYLDACNGWDDVDDDLLREVYKTAREAWFEKHSLPRPEISPVDFMTRHYMWGPYGTNAWSLHAEALASLVALHEEHDPTYPLRNCAKCKPIVDFLVGVTEEDS